MKRAVLACLLATAGIGASRQGQVPTEERWRPLGDHRPTRARYGIGGTGEVRVPAGAAFPDGVRARVRAFGAEGQPAALWRAASRGSTGQVLEAWVLERPLPAGSGADWLLFASDAHTGQVSAAPVRLSDRWIMDEGPTIRFADLDDDGRDELVVRQLRHNGTVETCDLELYFSIEPDLSLRHHFTLRATSNDLDSQGEYGKIHQRLLRSPAGDLRVDVWRENPRYGVPPTTLGWLELSRDAGGCWSARSHTLSEDPLDSSSRHPYEGSSNEHLQLEMPEPGPR